MKKESIIQFVCFSTQLDLEVFIGQWEHYARELNAGRPGTMILHQGSSVPVKYKYVSQHIYNQKEDMRFAFMKGRNSDHFVEQKVKVIQAGGYAPLQIGCKHYNKKTDIKIIAFISHQENDIDSYRRLVPSRCLNIYEAYYESCTYGYILEFFVPEANSADLLRQLKEIPSVEVSVYSECAVPQLV